MNNLFSRFIKDDSGATAIEYGLIAALMAVVLITSFGAIGDGLTETFELIADALSIGA